MSSPGSSEWLLLKKKKNGQFCRSRKLPSLPVGKHGCCHTLNFLNGFPRHLKLQLAGKRVCGGHNASTKLSRTPLEVQVAFFSSSVARLPSSDATWGWGFYFFVPIFCATLILPPLIFFIHFFLRIGVRVDERVRIRLKDSPSFFGLRLALNSGLNHWNIPNSN